MIRDLTVTLQRIHHAHLNEACSHKYNMEHCAGINRYFYCSCLSVMLSISLGG